MVKRAALASLVHPASMVTWVHPALLVHLGKQEHPAQTAALVIKVRIV